MRYFLEFSFNGSRYHGWQKQPNVNTVQEELNKCLSILLEFDINLMGAGRTDSGVHANQMFAHFDCERIIDSKNIVHKMNSFIPKDILIHSVFQVKEDSHARFSAISRTYKYYISSSKDVFNPNVHLVHKNLDVDKMNKACQYLIGNKDFTSFSKVNTDTYTNNCLITSASWENKGDYTIFTISANRFLRNMVRSLVGTLIDIGLGTIEINEINSIIEKKDRCSAGVSVPAKGLFLYKITYPENI